MKFLIHLQIMKHIFLKNLTLNFHFFTIEMVGMGIQTYLVPPFGRTVRSSSGKIPSSWDQENFEWFVVSFQGYLPPADH